MSLGTTLAEKAGIKIDGENKWMTIIQNAEARMDSFEKGK